MNKFMRGVAAKLRELGVLDDDSTYDPIARDFRLPGDWQRVNLDGSPYDPDAPVPDIEPGKSGVALRSHLGREGVTWRR
jgi:hypothetical protein